MINKLTVYLNENEIQIFRFTKPILSINIKDNTEAKELLKCIKKKTNSTKFSINQKAKNECIKLIKTNEILSHRKFQSSYFSIENLIDLFKTKFLN